MSGTSPREITLWFGRHPNSRTDITVTVRDLGNGIALLDRDVADLLHSLRMDVGSDIYRKLLNRRYLHRRGKRASAWPGTVGFERYGRTLLEMLVEDLHSGRTPSARKLVESFSKFTPIPEGFNLSTSDTYDPTRFRDQWKRDPVTGRNLQILELPPGDGRSYGENSGVRVIIANGGDVANTGVIPGDRSCARNCRGTWSIVSLPHGLLLETEDRIIRPDIMLGTLLRTAASLQSGSYDDTIVELPIRTGPRKRYTRDTALSYLSSFEILGNQSALNYYNQGNRRSAGHQSPAPIPVTWIAAEVAEKFNAVLRNVTHEQTMTDTGLADLIHRATQLAALRADTAEINEALLSTERGLTPRISPAFSSGSSWIYQHRLLDNPHLLTRAILEAPQRSGLHEKLLTSRELVWKKAVEPIVGNVPDAQEYMRDNIIGLTTTGANL
ncbi:hypothetical protein IU450_25875 [Nocardia abscessus]|uniref:hypothetical protein n=1 Tax=Nocardia abscessus TaxID=120957 RepID=UPI001895ADD3|nr:hypothetical protein [Nocardia abscessus]MBF6339296.1 hypothetical protein [Nocardia abscessus]